MFTLVLQWKSKLENIIDSIHIHPFLFEIYLSAKKVTVCMLFAWKNYELLLFRIVHRTIDFQEISLSDTRELNKNTQIHWKVSEKTDSRYS